MMPALASGVLTIAPALSAASAPTTSTRPGYIAPVNVTVNENAPPTVMDLRVVFASVNGLQHSDGLKFAILGNTNPQLVQTTLSDAALRLTYTQGMSGTATITVCATDADGVSVKRTIQVTVLPSSSGGVVSVSPPPPGRLVR
jgi:hypothetical protein